MPEMVIRAHEGFGPVDFGMTREGVIAALGPPEQPFANAARNHEKLHYTKEFGIVVEFDEAHCVSRVSAFVPTCVPIFEGIRLAGAFDEVVAALREGGYELQPGPPSGPPDANTLSLPEAGMSI